MSQSYQMDKYSQGENRGNENKGFSGDLEDGNYTSKDMSHSHQGNDKCLNNYNNGDSAAGGIDDDDDEEEEEEEDNVANVCSNIVGKFQNSLSDFVDRYGVYLWMAFYILLFIGYFVYFAYAIHYEFGSEGSWRLMICTLLGVLILTNHLVTKLLKKPKQDGESDDDSPGCRGRCSCSSCATCMKKARIEIILFLLLFIGFIVLICVDIYPNQPRNLVSLSGMAFFIITFYIFSFNPAKVKWRPVIWGLTIQIVFGLLILRTTVGYEAFKWLGDRVKEFLDYADEGSKFVFGDKYTDHFFAFKVLPVVVFFSTVVTMLYYLGVMQVIIRLLGKSLAWCLGTSPTESINAAGNIFVGQTEAPLMIRPFLSRMTNSEIHAVMTGGFATIAGGVMAAYIKYDVPANHLLSASVMSAPAALALSKLFYPETKKTRIRSEDVYKLAKGSERNLIEAATNGASMSISLVANIAVNLIAFIALITFVNSTLMWFGDRVGYGELTFENICSYVFWPVSFLMGVEQDDCRKIAELIGIKTFLNEFVAYVELSKYIHNREDLDSYLFNATKNLTQNLTGSWWEKDGGIFLQDTGAFLENGIISDRSVVIATYALCGFSNLSSMGIQLGALGAMAPTRRSDMSRIVFRAMLAGNAACFMTASISGFLYEGP